MPIVGFGKLSEKKQKFYIQSFAKMQILVSLVVSLIVVVLFIGGYYLITGKPPGAKLIEQDIPITQNGMDESNAKFMFFYAPWCPHCKTADTVWRSFKEMHKNDDITFGGRKIVFEEINSDANKGKTALYNIKAYPTFKVETESKLYEMGTIPSVENFETFLTTALGEKKITNLSS
jgi:thiol-disulfide isomerase/thioredoxin